MFKGFTVAIVALISTAQLDLIPSQRSVHRSGDGNAAANQARVWVLNNSFGAEARDGHLMG